MVCPKSLNYQKYLKWIIYLELKVYLYKDSTVDTFIPENMIDGSYQINFKI